VLIPILVPLFAGLLLWLGERDAASAANDRVIAGGRVVSANVRRMVEAALERLETYDAALGPDPAKFVPRGSPTANMFTALYDAAGATIGRDGARGQSVSTSAEFKQLAAGKTWVVTPMLGTAETLRFFGIARRIERDGKFAGVVTAYMSVESLSDAWTDAGLGVDSTVAVLRSDGWLVARYPAPPEAVNISDQPLFTRHLVEAPSGVYMTDSSLIDRIPRRVAYQSLPDLELVVTASMARTSTTEAFWSRVGSTAMVAGPSFVVLAILCGWAVMLLIRQERNRLALGDALDRNRVLLQEIHHRVKNNLQQVASLVRLQQAPAAMKEDLTRRIAAMSAVHQHIYESGQYGIIDSEAYLARMLTGLRETAPPHVTLDWRLAPLRLSPDQAVPLGLIVNEVVSNAFKHAFPDGRAGSVTVALERPLEGDEAVLTIADNGVGMAETPSGGQGLGTRLIAGLAQQLDGKTSVTRGEGVRFELRFPAEAKS
jgi:two-component sensor histidine kinase